MIINMERFAYLDDCTRGELFIQNHTFQTVEKPWIKNPEAPGGLPFKSCIPDGEYRMRSFTRPNGDKVFILSNPDLGVYEQEFNVPEPGRGRYLILIHSGNSSEDVVGCIAPGMSGDVKNVWNSRKAMASIMELLEGYEHKLKIGPRGTNN